MPSRDPNIPDMSLGDHAEKPAPPAPPPAVEIQHGIAPPSDTEIQRAAQPTPRGSLENEAGAEPQWDEGDRALAPWEPTFLYPGTIRQIQIDESKGDQALIRYDDGNEGWVFLYSLCPLKFETGQQVYVRRGGGNVYAPGEIIDVDDKEVRVRYDDGSTEWTPTMMVRIPCVANGPGAIGTQSAPWQTPHTGDQGGGGIPNWLITVGIIILIAFLRFGCRAMQN